MNKEFGENVNESKTTTACIMQTDGKNESFK